MDSIASRDLVDRALAGDGEAVDTLVEQLQPVIQARVARVVLARRAGGSPVRQQVEDLTQEVFLSLFAGQGRVLRSWAPDRGLSLANFVGLVAARRAISLLRGGHAGVLDEELDDEGFEPESEAADPELASAGREELRRLLDRLRGDLSPQGWQVFSLLYMEERSVEEVMAATGLSADAVYAWRSRLRRRALRIAAELRSGPQPGRRTPLMDATR
jgi:RNA polymerase sigma-70 factor (ECF subfamily)